MKLDLKYNGNNIEKMTVEVKRKNNNSDYKKLVDEANKNILEAYQKDREAYKNVKSFVARTRTLKRNS